MIYVASDHGGFEKKNTIVSWLTKNGLQVTDLGPTVLNPEDDYPQFAKLIADALQKSSPEDKGILLCRSGVGMTIAVNKFPRIRAVNALNGALARQSREHMDANVLVLPADVLSEIEIQSIVDIFLSTPFTNEERHVRRLGQMLSFEVKNG